jgi:hypothetical protein
LHLRVPELLAQVIAGLLLIAQQATGVGGLSLPLRLHEPLEAISLRLAYWAHFRRLSSGAKVAANRAAPYRQWKSCWFRARFEGFPFSLLGRPSPLRDAACLLLAFPHGIGYVQSAVASVELTKIGIPVVTGTDNIQIVFFLPGSEPARAGPIAISPFINDKALDQLLGRIHIRIDVIAGGLGFSQQPVIQPVNLGYSYVVFIHSRSASLISSSL